jgi:hypothetical protein
VGNFEVWRIIELEKFFLLKVPQIGGFRGRKNLNDRPIIDLYLHGNPLRKKG